MTRSFLSLCFAVSLAVLAQAQPPGAPATNPTFEVAGVRISRPGITDGGGFVTAGRAEFKSATMLDLISAAYGVEHERVTGGPNCLATDRFDFRPRFALDNRRGCAADAAGAARGAVQTRDPPGRQAP